MPKEDLYLPRSTLHDWADGVGLTSKSNTYTPLYLSNYHEDFLADWPRRWGQAQTTICDLLLLSSLFGGKPKTLLK
jgi:hypothetical protein